MATTNFIDHLLKGDHASRPAANTVPEGTLYACSDHDLIYQSDGGSWSTWADVSPGSTNLAGSELDYVEKTSDTSITATSGATANTIVTGAAVSYDGSTVVLIEFQADGANPDTGAAGRLLDIVLYDGSTELGILARVRTTGSGGNIMASPVRGARRVTPSNGSHTYSVRAYVSAGTGSVYGGSGAAGNHMPCFMRITRVSA